MVRVRAIIKKGSKFLLIKSAEPQSYGQWLFVGGNADSSDLKEEIKREVKEEIGADLKNTLYAFTIEGRRGKILFYTGNISGKLKLQKNEVMDYGYFSKAEIKKLNLANSTKLAMEKL